MSISSDAIIYYQSNDKKSMHELLKKVARRANSRLRSLEKNEYNYYAYDLAIEFTQQNFDTYRYSYNKNLSIEEMRDELLNIDRFLMSKSSTVSGQREIERNRFEKLKMAGFDISIVGINEKREFLRFLGSDSIRRIIDAIGNSDRVVQNVSNMYKAGVSTYQIEQSAQKYLDNEISYYDWLKLSERLKNANNKSERRTILAEWE